MKNFIAQAVSQFGAIWKKIGVNQRISIVLVGVLIIGGLWAFVSIARRPDYEALFTNVSPEDGAAISAHLRENGIPYKARGSNIYVPASRKDQVRMDLAAKGLPKSDRLGWNDLFPAGGFGKTESELRINYRRALQGDLASSIESLSSIRSAKIHIVLPEEELFREDEKPATASVVIGLQPGAVLREEQVNAIRFLLSKSVKGLDVANIAIVDTDGKVYAAGTGSDSLAGLTDNQLTYKSKVETDLAMKAQSMLNTTLGPGKSVVQVVAEINFDETSTINRKTTSGAMTEEITSVIDDKDSSKKAAGEPGTPSNFSVFAGGDTGTGTTSSSKSEMTKTYYAPSETVTQILVKPGAIKRLSVAAFIDKNRDKDGYTETDFEEIIKLAVGYDEKRGDAIKVREIDFATASEKTKIESGTRTSAIVGHLLKNLPLAVVIIVLLVFFRQLLKKTKLPEHKVPEEFRDISRKGSAARARGAKGADDMGVKEAEELLELPEHETPTMHRLMWKLADEKPEDLAQMLRSWLKD